MRLPDAMQQRLAGANFSTSHGRSLIATTRCQTLMRAFDANMVERGVGCCAPGADAAEDAEQVPPPEPARAAQQRAPTPRPDPKEQQRPSNQSRQRALEGVAAGGPGEEDAPGCGEQADAEHIRALHHPVSIPRLRVRRD